MATQPVYLKDPSAVLDYGFTWDVWLEGVDFIESSTWSVPAGLVSVLEWNDASTTAIRLSGGTVGATYIVTNHIVTDASREDDRSFVIKCVER